MGYFEAIDALISEVRVSPKYILSMQIERRFDQSSLITLFAMEQVILDAANGKLNGTEIIQLNLDSSFDFSRLNAQLVVLEAIFSDQVVLIC